MSIPPERSTPRYPYLSLHHKTVSRPCSHRNLLDVNTYHEEVKHRWTPEIRGRRDRVRSLDDDLGQLSMGSSSISKSSESKRDELRNIERYEADTFSLSSDHEAQYPEQYSERMISYEGEIGDGGREHMTHMNASLDAGYEADSDKTQDAPLGTSVSVRDECIIITSMRKNQVPKRRFACIFDTSARDPTATKKLKT